MQISTDENLLLNNYIPVPFWAMKPLTWQKYIKQLSPDDPRVLKYYPFKWAYVHPNSAGEAIEFLQDIGVDEGAVRQDSVENQWEILPSFESLVMNGSVDWGEPSGDDIPPPGFRIIAEWEPMAGTLINWPTFYPPLWETFRQMVAAASNATVFLRIPEGYLGAAVIAWLEVNGIDLTTMTAIPGPVGDIWAKDYSPVYGVDHYSGDPIAHKLAFACFHPEYRRDYQAIRDIDNKFAWREGFNV
jgi:hypothetical protein